MLITRCPNCGTTFRIRPEQLGVRGGRVRCGSCRTAFSALNSLEEIDDGPEAAAGSPVTAGAAAAPTPAAAAPVVPAPAVSKPVSAPTAARTALDAKQPLAANPVPSTARPPVMPREAAPQMLAQTDGAVPPLPPFSADPPLTGGEPGVGQLTDGRKEPSLESSWFDIDPNLPTGGFNSVPEVSRPPEPRSPVFAGLDLPKIDDAPPLFDPSKVQALEQRKPAEEDAFRIEFDLSAVEGKKEPAKAPPAVPAEPYKSKIAEELGIAPYQEPKAEEGAGGAHTEYTYMLNETVEAHPGMAADVEHSLQMLHEEQEKSKRGRGVEDRRKKRGGWMWALAALVIGVAVAAQLSFLFRTELARAMPGIRPLLEDTCKQLGCTVPYPQDSAQISIESSNLLADPGEERSRLVVTMRNKAGYAVAWPYLELTLTDKFDIAISRRVLKPAEWMPSAYAQTPALEAHSEVTATIVLVTGKPEPAGYRLYAFYP